LDIKSGVLDWIQQTGLDSYTKERNVATILAHTLDEWGLVRLVSEVFAVAPEISEDRRVGSGIVVLTSPVIFLGWRRVIV